MAGTRGLAAIAARILVPAALAASLGGTAGAAETARPDSVGVEALSLAAVVGLADQRLPAPARRALATVFDGHPAAVASLPAVEVAADAVLCRAGGVDITAESCDIAFRGAKRSLSGRAAHELYATLLQNGLSAEGAAGSTFVGLRDLACTVDPRAAAARDGSGAACRFRPDR